MLINELLRFAVKKGASDIHITVGIPPFFRVNGQLEPVGDKTLEASDIKELVKSIMNESQLKNLKNKGEEDFSYSINGLGRFRVNAYKQRGSIAVAIRVIPSSIPSPEDIELPDSVHDIAKMTKGLVLVTGPTGSGKSTTIASIINLINKQRSYHILTLEDPIEYLHKHDKSIINQREINSDSLTYKNSLRAALRQDPDVIFVGEMRDLETISTVITAAETGHLVLSTLHTIGAAKTIDRIIDVFPPHQQQQIRFQLATILKVVISQQLIQRKDTDGRIAAYEMLFVNSAIQNLIRESKTHQINSVIQTGNQSDMQTMDTSLAYLYKQKIISKEDALNYSMEKEIFKSLL